MPACEHLKAALDGAKAEDGPVADVARTLEAIAPRLKWVLRPNGEDDDTTFKSSHANAVVIGEDGLEARDDIRIGMSLWRQRPATPIIAIHLKKSTRSSPPANGNRVPKAFRSPGVGGFVHNIPNIVHGMRSKDVPLLAVWSLWMGDDT